MAKLWMFQQTQIINKAMESLKTLQENLVIYFYTKLKSIKKLIKLYPQIKWIMFGDSGEKDLQTYIKIAKEYSKSVKAIYIRDVKSGVVKRVY